MIKVSILAETTGTDRNVHTNLIGTIFGEILGLNLEKEIEFIQLDKFNPQGKNDLLGQIHIAIKLLLEKDKNLNLIVVIVDGDKSNRNEQHKIIKDLLLSKIKVFPLEQIIIGVAVRNIEAWLLTDPKPINGLLGENIIKKYPQSEKIKKPKIEMRQIYGRYCLNCKEKDLIPLKYPEFLIHISKELSPKKLMEYSSSFRALVKDLVSFVKAKS